MKPAHPPLSKQRHREVFEQVVMPDSKVLERTSHERPKAVILGGQPGSGKGGLARTAKREFGGDVVIIDPDEMRKHHPEVDQFRAERPYTWSGDTHADASAWADELRVAAVAGKKNIVFDTTLSNGEWTAEMVKDLQAKGYDVEVRVVAAHKLESELGVDKRFADRLDAEGHGRHVPEAARTAIYDKIPASLDKVAAETGVPIRIYSREGALLFDSSTSPKAPSAALEEAREARLNDRRVSTTVNDGWQAQKHWHRNLPEDIKNNPKTSEPTAEQVLAQRKEGAVEEQVKADAAKSARHHHGRFTVPDTVKGLGVAGAAYGAYDAKGQVDAAIASATSTKDQWIKGGAEVANQATKTAVTGTAATAGAVPGAAAGTLTSPVTGPAGPVLGGLATGTAAAIAAEKAYENSRLQTWSKAAGAALGEAAYEHLSAESRLHKAVLQAEAAASAETDPVKQAGLQTQLVQARSAWGDEVESNNRHFEGKGVLENRWPLVQSRFPKVDKADLVDELDRHLGAGKAPAEAVRAAINNSVNAHYPRTLMQVPLEDVTSLSTEALKERFAAAAAHWAKAERQVQAWEGNKDTRNDLDAGWPKALAEQRHAERVEGGRAQAWKDMGVLGAIHDEIKARGLDPRTVLPPLAADSATGFAKDLTKDAKDAAKEPLRLTPEQQRQWERVETQIGPGLRERGLNPEQVQRVVAACLGEAQAHPERGPIKSVPFAKDGQSLAVVHADGRFGEVQISEALGKSREQHLGVVQPSNQVAGQAQQGPRQDGAAAPAPEPPAPEVPTPEVPARARR